LRGAAPGAAHRAGVGGDSCGCARGSGPSSRRAALSRVVAAWLARRASFPVTAPGSGFAVGLDLDQLAADAGVAQLPQHVAGQVCRQLHDREVRPNLDVTEVIPAEATLIGEGPDDLPRLDPLALAHFDAVGRHRLGGPCAPLTPGRTFTAIVAVEPLGATVALVAPGGGVLRREQQGSVTLGDDGEGGRDIR